MSEPARYGKSAATTGDKKRDPQARKVEKSRAISGMFDRIAPTYDLLNRLLSLGQDQKWREAAIRAGDPHRGERWLDLACGSGDMILAGLDREPETHWIGADPSSGLLREMRGKERLSDVPAVRARAEHLPFADDAFDGVTVAFGVRNFADIKAGLNELARVLKPGGHLMIVEFHPVKPGKWGNSKAVSFYLEKVIPVVGTVISRRPGAYSYLARTSRGFWSVERLAKELRAVGFSTVKWRELFMKSVMLTYARRGRS